jgi:cytochrome c
LYDYINRAMPLNAPGSLNPSEIYAVVAWVLNRNEIIPPTAVIDAATLPRVIMPARARFVPDDRRPGPEFR